MRNVTTSRRRACRSCFFTSKFWFAECKWDVSIANHVLQQKISWIDLSPKNLITNVKFILASIYEKLSNYYSYLDLSLHCNAKQCNEIHDENRPENRDVEEIKKCTNKCNDCSFCGWIPKFEFWQPTKYKNQLILSMIWAGVPKTLTSNYPIIIAYLLMNGRNSSFCLVGNAIPSSSAASSAASNSAMAGSI